MKDQKNDVLETFYDLKIKIDSFETYIFAKKIVHIPTSLEEFRLIREINPLFGGRTFFIHGNKTIFLHQNIIHAYKVTFNKKDIIETGKVNMINIDYNNYWE